MNGSVTICMNPAAIAASKALPPASSTSTPVSTAAGWGATTMPFTCLPPGYT